MTRRPRIKIKLIMRLSLLASALLLAAPWTAQAGSVAAKTVTAASSLRAFARVEPIVLVRVKAPVEGTLAGLKVLPGERVAAGTVLARLQGPAVEAALSRSLSAVAAARAALSAARRLLALEKEKLKVQLTTLSELYRAEAAVAQQQSRLDEASSQLRSVRESLTLRAPATGSVVSVEAAAGELAQPGETLLTLQPRGGLWIVATFFGTDAGTVHVGQSGSFAPSAGRAAIPVTVRTIIGASAPGSGLRVGLSARAAAPPLLNGETGTVTLKGATGSYLAVPTRALILDRGKWWVLLHSPHGLRKQEVVPGPSRGQSTLVARGLKAGDRVEVDDAYLLFHRDFSRRYQAPD